MLILYQKGIRIASQGKSGFAHGADAIIIVFAAEQAMAELTVLMRPLPELVSQQLDPKSLETTRQTTNQHGHATPHGDAVSCRLED